MYPKKKKDFELLPFTPPRRHDGKESYISFTALDPVSGKMKRKKYMLDRYRKGRERDFMATYYMSYYYLKLFQGWNPWIDKSTPRGDIDLTTVLRNYHLYLDKLAKKKIIKRKTYVDWNSRAKILESYLHDYHRENMLVCQIDKIFVVDYLDYVLLDRDVSATTRNNHRAWLSTFCNWLVEKGHIENNPVSEVPMLAEREKFREPLSRNALIKLRLYLQGTDKHFLLAVFMAYYTLIRPTELTQIKLENIDIKNQTVFIPSSISKNRKDGLVALNDKIIKLMIELNTFARPNHFYLFGKNLLPSDTPTTAAVFRSKFAEVRKVLHFPDKYQFYSLKDSGIRDLANAEGIVNARNQARHSDIATTNKYLKGKDTPIDDRTKHFKGNL